MLAWIFAGVPLVFLEECGVDLLKYAMLAMQ